MRRLPWIALLEKIGEHVVAEAHGPGADEEAPDEPGDEAEVHEVRRGPGELREAEGPIDQQREQRQREDGDRQVGARAEQQVHAQVPAQTRESALQLPDATCRWQLGRRRAGLVFGAVHSRRLTFLRIHSRVSNPASMPRQNQLSQSGIGSSVVMIVWRRSRIRSGIV